MNNEQIQANRKAPYAPPKATFVPLNLEERLLACCKLTAVSACTTGNGANGS